MHIRGYEHQWPNFTFLFTSACVRQVVCCLGWHLATQIMYFISVGLLLLCEIYSRAQLCCMQRKSVYRTLGIILLVSCK